jgi:hypothetical protein
MTAAMVPDRPCPSCNGGERLATGDPRSDSFTTFDCPVCEGTGYDRSAEWERTAAAVLDSLDRNRMLSHASVRSRLRQYGCSDAEIARVLQEKWQQEHQAGAA